MNVQFAQIFTQIISFLLVLWVLKRFAWKPFLKILEDREKRIQKEFDFIDKEKADNANLKQQYEDQLKNAAEEAKGVIKEARDTGLDVAKKIEDRAHDEARRILNQAQEELQREIQQAKAQLKDELVNISLKATGKMLEANVDNDKQKTLMREFIDKA